MSLVPLADAFNHKAAVVLLTADYAVHGASSDSDEDGDDGATEDKDGSGDDVSNQGTGSADQDGAQQGDQPHMLSTCTAWTSGKLSVTATL